MKACMGGWCRSREKCAHYHVPASLRHSPVERLCGQAEQPQPMRVVRIEAFRRLRMAGAPA